MTGVVFLVLALILCCAAAGWTVFLKIAADRARAREARDRIRKKYTRLKLDWSRVMDYTHIVPGEKPEA